MGVLSTPMQTQCTAQTAIHPVCGTSPTLGRQPPASRSTSLRVTSTRTQPGLNQDSTRTQPGLNLDSTWTQPGLNLDSTWTQPGLNLGRSLGTPPGHYTNLGTNRDQDRGQGATRWDSNRRRAAKSGALCSRYLGIRQPGRKRLAEVQSFPRTVQACDWPEGPSCETVPSGPEIAHRKPCWVTSTSLSVPAPAPASLPLPHCSHGARKGSPKPLHRALVLACSGLGPGRGADRRERGRAHPSEAQRCLKLAGRFSRKARMPSFWSSVAKRP